ncbi:hypothetical protein B0H14DRAFT_3491065 [Mycena olivaceomarginata]|nr:hypothetical protein B0H14DRAFT_3491065 [Mycena olivaceomarginata]
MRRLRVAASPPRRQCFSPFAGRQLNPVVSSTFKSSASFFRTTAPSQSSSPGSPPQATVAPINSQAILKLTSRRFQSSIRVACIIYAAIPLYSVNPA